MTFKEYTDALIKLSEFYTKEVEQLKKQIEELIEQRTPAEPLIKDEKIRKAVRAWAEANDVKIIRIRTVGKTLLRCIGKYRKVCYIDIEFMLDNTECYEDLHDNIYTIAELCGEEEEC